MLLESICRFEAGFQFDFFHIVNIIFKINFPQWCCCELPKYHADSIILGIIAVIETGRIKTMTKVSQMGHETNRPLRSTAKTILNKIPYRLIQRDFRIAEVIPTSKTGNIQPFKRPQRMDIEKRRQFGQI